MPIELVFPNLRAARLLRQMAESLERDYERRAAAVAVTLEMSVREFAADAGFSKSQAARLMKRTGPHYTPRAVNPAYTDLLDQLQHIVNTMPTALPPASP